MKHARAVLDAEGALYHCAGQRVVWAYDPRADKRFPRSTGEDILGCFDVLAIVPSGRVWLVQVTTQSGSTSNVRLRQRKIDDALGARVPHAAVYVWAWVKGRHFRCWMRGNPGEWHEWRPIRSPLLKEAA